MLLKKRSPEEVLSHLTLKYLRLQFIADFHAAEAERQRAGFTDIRRYGNNFYCWKEWTGKLGSLKEAMGYRNPQPFSDIPAIVLWHTWRRKP